MSQYRTVGLAVGFASIPVAIAGIFWWPILLLALPMMWSGVFLASHSEKQVFEPGTTPVPLGSVRSPDILKLWRSAPPEVKILRGEIWFLPGLPKRISLHVYSHQEGREDLTLEVSDILADRLMEEPGLDEGALGYFLVKDNHLLDFTFTGIPTPQDPEIVTVTKELCQELGLTGVDAERIYWEESVLPCSLKPYEYVVGTKGPYALHFSNSVAGKLEAQEWVPLIASALIFQRKLWKNRLLSDLRFYFAVAGLMFTIFFASGRPVVGFRILPPDLYLLPGMGLSFAGIIGASKLKKRTAFRADREAVRLFGRERTLEALTRVQALLPSPTKAKHGRLVATLLNTEPSLGERIRELQKNNNPT